MAMKNEDRETRYTRFYFILATFFTLAGLYAMFTAGKLMFTQGDYWEAVRQRLTTVDSIPARRGIIYSADGEVLSTTLPEYIIRMDYKAYDQDSATMAKAQAWRDSAFERDLDSIAEGLAVIFPKYDKTWFANRLKEGKAKKRRNWKVYPFRVTHVQYTACKQLPLFRETPNKGGFYAEKQPQRKKPYGSLASRTIGNIDAMKDSAMYGIELWYDSLLRGKQGLRHITKVRNRRLSFVDQPPVDGHDIVTTIDIGIQDAAEKSLVSKLKEIDGDMGVVILMECATGDVKAIVNMARCTDGVYREVTNSAMRDRMEPGSTFKTASIMVALEDGMITLDDKVDCTGGVKIMHGSRMTDHNRNRGGYGVLNTVQALMYSSNIAVSGLIDPHYFNCPEKFVDGLHREGVGIPLELPFKGVPDPIVRRPRKDATGRYWANWSKTALAWMSIGYETQLTPLNTVTFYNAIGNGGRMVKPRFVKAEMANGQVVREYPVEVLREHICSDKTLEQIQFCLEKVVSEGLGRKAGNKLFPVSGKTGTAQVADEHGGYHSGQPRYLISFCGYFPSDAPKYSCIVAIRKKGLPASGGGMCGPVFREISQVVMSRGVFREPSEGADSTSVFTPSIKPTTVAMDTCSEEGMTVVPDVTGMGARSAVRAMVEAGLSPTIKGMGVVKRQSLQKKAVVKHGSKVSLELE